MTNAAGPARRDDFLLALDDATRGLTLPRDITATTARMLAEQLQADRCAYADVQAPGTFDVIGDYCATAASMVGRYPLAAFGEDFVKACRAGEPYVVDDAETDPRTEGVRDAYRKADIRAVISVALVKDGQFVGGMAVHQKTPRHWNREEVQLVRLVVNRCWESIERARITRQLIRKTRSLGLLANAGTRLLSEEQPEQLIQSLFEEAAEISDVELCFHFLLADDGQHLRLAVCHGIDMAECQEIAYVDLDEAVCGSVALSRRPVFCRNVQSETDPLVRWIRSIDVRAYACFPLIAGGELVGTLSFGSRSRSAFDDEDLTFLQALSDQVAVAYARAAGAAALRASEERLQQAVAIAGLGTFEVDVTTDCGTVNEPGRAIYGWASGEPITFARIQSQFHPADYDRVMKIVRAAHEPSGANAFDVEHRIIRSDGAERWIRVRGQVLFDTIGGRRQPVRALGTFLDITDRKHAEHRREALLEAERSARENAERLGRLKDEFLATVSHELRTPLNAILGWSQLLERRGINIEDTRRAIETIGRNARAQAVLIDDLLDMNRIVSGKIRLEMHTVDLALAVSTAVESVQPTARAKGVRIHETDLAEAPTIVGDAARIQQVLWNLLSNALKFTPAGGEIELTLRQDGGNAVIEVRDTGAGIAPEFLPYIFEPFRQQDASTTRRHGGVGLGLSIVKQLVDLHGGSVTAFSEGPGRGARFVVSLPLERDAHPARRRNTAPPVGAQPGTAIGDTIRLTGLKVLIVDDEPDAQQVLGRILQDAGATVFAADSAEAALAQLERRTPDILISDIGMPLVDGYELIARVRASETGRIARIPAIALSAYARPDDRQRALQAGYQAHIAKPVNITSFLATLAGIAHG